MQDRKLQLYGISEWKFENQTDGRIEPGAQKYGVTGKIGPASRLEHMLMIAVQAEPQREIVNFGWLRQKSLDRVGGLVRGGESLDRLLMAAAFAPQHSRALSSALRASYAVRALSWKVRSAGQPSDAGSNR